MINANELRIGNLCLDHNAEYHEVSIKDFHRFNVPKMDGDYGLYPIPLTEEILLKCGFEKEPMAYRKSIDYFGGGKKLTFSGDYLYIVDSEKQNTIPTDIITLWNKDICKEFYLHQLQNLYFALTGQELEINL